MHVLSGWLYVRRVSSRKVVAATSPQMEKKTRKIKSVLLRRKDFSMFAVALLYAGCDEKTKQTKKKGIWRAFFKVPSLLFPRNN